MSDDNIKYFLYVKEHVNTGLKYLGMTSKNPFKYSGSGLHWKRHLKLHGKQHRTEIICECESLKEISEKGLYYSELWNIVDSSEWANIKPETGAGAPSGKYHHYSSKSSEYNKTRHPLYGKKHSDESIEKNRLSNSGKNNSMYNTVWINDGKINKKIRKEEAVPNGWKIGRIISYSDKFGKTNKLNDKNPNYDFTVRTFQHKSGIIEHCTRRELINKYDLRESSVSQLIKGKLKSTNGWKML